MRILYGVCGEGFGHSAIASEVIPFLEKKGHKIKVVTYEKGLIFLKGFDIVPVKGLILKYEGGKVNYLKTVYLNAINFPKNFLKIGQIKKIIEEFNPELCITDNEPIVAQTAYLKKIPLISLSALNNFVFDDLRKPVSKLASSTLAKAIVLAITPKADVRIAISLSDRTYEKKGVMFTSPTIREAIRKSVVKKENFILAYLAKSHEHLLKFLEKIPEKFLVYGIKERRKIKNISFEDRHETFADNFGKCKAIIANSGYSVITEAIYLKKPIFMIPIKGQYEQFYNAVLGKRKGIGEFSEKPTEKEIRNFLENLNKYEKNLKKINYLPDEPLKVLESTISSLKSAPDRI